MPQSQTLPSGTTNPYSLAPLPTASVPRTRPLRVGMWVMVWRPACRSPPLIFLSGAPSPLPGSSASPAPADYSARRSDAHRPARDVSTSAPTWVSLCSLLEICGRRGLEDVVSALAQDQLSAHALFPRFLLTGVREAGHPGTVVATSGRSSPDRPLPDWKVRPPHLPAKPAHWRAHTPLAGEEIRIRKELFPFPNAGLDSEPAPPGVDSPSDHLGLWRPRPCAALRSSEESC